MASEEDLIYYDDRNYIHHYRPYEYSSHTIRLYNQRFLFSIMTRLSFLVIVAIVIVSYFFYPQQFFIVLIFSALTATILLYIYYSYLRTVQMFRIISSGTARMFRDIGRHSFRSHPLSDLWRPSYESLVAKRKELTKTPKIFYYLDNSVIKSLHNQIASSVRTREITVESGKTTSKGVDLKLPIHPSYQSEKLRTEKRRAEVVEPMEKQFEDVLNYLLDHELVKIGIEEFDYDKKTENEFLATCHEIKDKFEFELPKNVMDQFIKINKQKYVDSKMQEIKSLSGYVLMSGEFSVTSKGEEWIVSYDHPVNEAADWETENRLILKSSCPKTEMTNIGNDTFSKTDRAKFVLLGNIVKFDENKLELVMRPIVMCS